MRADEWLVLLSFLIPPLVFVLFAIHPQLKLPTRNKPTMKLKLKPKLLMLMGGAVVLIILMLVLWPERGEAFFRNWTTIDPDEEYKVEVRDINIRVYEWTPAANDAVTCLFVGSEKGANIECIEKSDDALAAFQANASEE